MPPPTQYRHSFIAPRWLKQPKWMRVLYSHLKPLDRIMNAMIEGVAATWPGVGTATALPALGQSRGIIQGPNEPNAMYEARLINWINAWNGAGGDDWLALNIQGFLTGAGSLGAGILPTVRVVHRNGQWTIAQPNATITFASSPWNWDGVNGWVDDVGQKPPATTANYWSDTWIVVAPDPFTRYTGTSDPLWLATAGQVGGGAGGGTGIGHDVSRAYVDGILAICKATAWRPPHTWLRSIIWAGDTTSFSPALFVTNPDGNYGNANKNVKGVAVPSRASSARYWDIFGGS